MLRRHVRRKQTQIAFESLSIEGGLMTAEWLSKIAQLQAAGQSDADYQIPKGLNLRDEIGRYWRIAQALWAEFQLGLSGSPEHTAITERFTMSLLAEVFGFGALTTHSPAETLDHSFHLSAYGIRGRVPIAIAPPGEGLDAPSSRFGEGGRRRSAFGLVQEYLNAVHSGFWGVATDGLHMRLLRENASLTRPAWIEVDLQRIFTEDRYADFVPVWLLFHSSRFGKADAPPEDCWLEVWRTAGRDEGIRARDQLRDGVEAALIALGQGFLSHRDNADLRRALENGTLTTQAYFQQLLRLVYRLIFLLTVEERNLLHPSDSSDSARKLYEEGYSLRSLRERASRRTARDRFSDLWEALKIVFRGTAKGEPRLGLPALGGLFSEDQCSTLDSSKIENRALIDAIFRLAWLREESGLARVNWRDMGPEEFGSIYESLLELHPLISIAERGFSFASETESKGNVRRLTSSYYTHDTLVQALLEAAVEPLIKRTIAEHPEQHEAAVALLRLAIIDPACGSGHFLLGAARRLAAHVARLNSKATPSIHEYREALRDVISKCVYGVDRNPMAVELCKTALWIETIVPGRPLSFLDSHIRCGDALLGIFDLGLLDGGIPGEAYEMRDGDDKEVANALRRLNKKRIQDIHTLPLFAAAAAKAHAVELLPEETVEQVSAKQSALLAAESEPSAAAARLRADLFCAAFFARKIPSTESAVPVSADVDKIAIGQQARPEAVKTATRLAAEHHFFHWPLMFPDVFARGGFDLVLGNPPWKKLRPDVNEWFQQYDPDIASMGRDEQERRITDLLSTPGVSEAWDNYRRVLYDSAAFMKKSGRFNLFAEGNLGKGEFDVYRMFVELALFASRPGGYAAQLVPENMLLGTNAAAIRNRIFSHCRLASVMHFENRNGVWFAGIHKEKKFCLYVAENGGTTETFSAAFDIDTSVKLERAFTGETIDYPVSMVREFSPDALVISKISNIADIAIVQKLYSRFPKFGQRASGLAEPSFMAELHMGNRRHLFGTTPTDLPLYQGSMIDAFDHRAQAYVSGHGKSAKWRRLEFGRPEKSIVPQWRVAIADIPESVGARWSTYRLGIADEANPNNSRTFSSALIPASSICGDKVPTVTFLPENALLMLLWLGVANSFCMDYIARKKVSMKMSKTILYSLPLPKHYRGTPVEHAIAERSLRLSATGPEMLQFWTTNAHQLGSDPERDTPSEEPAVREKLRAELDVLVARDIFGLTRDEMRYLLDPSDILGADCDFETFGALKRAEQRQYREFRTRRIILEAWDSLPTFTQTPEPAAAAL